MNIPAKQICDHIDTQVIKLRKAVADGDRTSIREASAVIEAYCQLLKGSGSPVVTQNPNIEVVPEKEYSAPQQPMTFSRPLTTQSENGEGEKGNLLDF
ncbi:DUF5327 family protein [Halalkalibacter lacteus]|uniref:DUF5327 family protein n=1 Tax=Halalkalibacter lacteus TaxID=3090663 RepID=UPI002FC5E29F